MLHYIHDEDATHWDMEDYGCSLVVELPDNEGWFARVALSAMAVAGINARPEEGIMHTVSARLLSNQLDDRWPIKAIVVSGDFSESGYFDPSDTSLEQFVMKAESDEWGGGLLGDNAIGEARLSAVEIAYGGCAYLFWHNDTSHEYRLGLDWAQVGLNPPVKEKKK